ncbi:MAG: hypothetical protein D6767_00545 [Candidatus Hydrogenedentota bacterium]|nr:MAG: hypothetical protein D6767_00545 [Candidatus Hydrogenedentota bacterium]
MPQWRFKKPVLLYFPGYTVRPDDCIFQKQGSVIMAHDRAMDHSHSIDHQKKVFRLHIDSRYPLLGLPQNIWMKFLPFVERIFITEPALPFEDAKANIWNPIHNTMLGLNQKRVSTFLLKPDDLPKKWKKLQKKRKFFIPDPSWTVKSIPCSKEEFEQFANCLSRRKELPIPLEEKLKKAHF